MIVCPKAMKELATQAFKYAIVGGVCTILDLALLYLLVRLLDVNYLTASVFSFMSGATLNYFLCTTWIFDKSRLENKREEFMYYIAITFVVLLINTGLMWWFTSMIGLYFIASKLIVICVTFTLNFLSRKYFLHTVWNK